MYKRTPRHVLLGRLQLHSPAQVLNQISIYARERPLLVTYAIEKLIFRSSEPFVNNSRFQTN